MQEIKSFLEAHKITGSGFFMSHIGIQKILTFRPSDKTRLSAIEKVMPDFAIRVRAFGPPICRAINEKGIVEISWATSKATAKKLPSQPQPYSIPIGVTTSGEDKFLYLPSAPHVLVAGSTGSGKSYWMHGVIRSALAQQMYVVMIDPKFGEFSEYADHSNAVHISSRESIREYTRTLVRHMNERYQKFAENKSKDLFSYNFSGVTEAYWPILVIIDEYADLVLGEDGEEWNNDLLQLAQKGRAAGIHIVLATQAPTSKLLQGELKANFPVRIAFKTAGAVASRVILEKSGAESLGGKGDGLIFDEAGQMVRFQGYVI